MKLRWMLSGGFASVLLSLLGLSACDPGRGAPETVAHDEQAQLVRQGRLVAMEGDPGDTAGWAVALSGDTALIGALYDEEGSGPGAVSVYVRAGTTWSEQQQLKSDGVYGDSFGWAVALSGDSALVGAPNDDETQVDQGSVYVFTRSGTTWTKTQKLVAFDAQAGDSFGFAIAMSGDTAIVSAYSDDDGSSVNEGSAYVFTRTGSTFTAGPKLVASDGTANDGFGRAIAFDGSQAVISAPYDDTPYDASGSAYVFSASSWTQTRKLVSPSPRQSALFGQSVAISGANALVGEPGSGAQGVYGVAYAYDTSSWTPAPVTPSTPSRTFGQAVGITGSLALVAYGPEADGSAVVFAKSGGTWSESGTLLPNPTTASFGYAIAAENGTFVLGAPYETVDGQANRGVAYAYVLDGSNGSSCAIGAECASGYCVESVCCNATCNGGCQSCQRARTGGIDGVCAPVIAGTDPKAACTDAGAASCANNGSCNGAGACALYATGTSCGAPTCSSSRIQNYECNGLGTCQSVQGSDCAPFRCSAGACSDPCDDNDDCVTGHYCSLGLCTPTLAIGEACDSDGDCSDGHCVDQVCCESECDGVCEACSTLVKGAGDDGRCEPVVAGSDPGDECSEQAAGTCGRTGECDGDGACQLRSLGTSCGASSCDENGTARGRLCDGAGQCVSSASGVDCTPYACVGGACSNPCAEPEDCVSGHVCVDGTCRTPGAEGTPCGGGSECTSGHCADGVCCDEACTGLCVACTADEKGQGADGACAPIRATLDPDDECALEEPSSCGQDGQCDGDGACSRWATGTECGTGSCQASVATNPARCDAGGVCMPGAEHACATGYLCDGAECATSCSDGALCDSGYHCDTELRSCEKDPEPGSGGAGGTGAQGGTSGDMGEGGASGSTTSGGSNSGATAGSAGRASPPEAGEGGASEPGPTAGKAGTESGAPGGGSAGTTAGAGGTSAGSPAHAAPTAEDGGCGCRVTRRSAPHGALLGTLVLVLFALRRRDKRAAHVLARDT